jgi:Tfp pilus assembly protein PilF
VEDLSRAIKLDPLNAESYCKRALARMRLNQEALGLGDCNQAIKLDSKYLAAYQQRAYLYRKFGKVDLAQKDLQRADALIKAQNHSKN